MSRKGKNTPPEEILKLYKALAATIPEVEVKGASTGYTSHNGHMFTFLSNEGDVGIRLPKDVAKKFIELFDSGPFIQYDRVMKDYVKIPAELLKETETLSAYLKISFQFVKTLKPK